MTRADLIKKISQITGLTEADSRLFLETFIKVVTNTLLEGEKVSLNQFGNFTLKKRAPKIARKIQTNETITVPAHYTVAFKPSKELKELSKNIFVK